MNIEPCFFTFLLYIFTVLWLCSLCVWHLPYAFLFCKYINLVFVISMHWFWLPFLSFSSCFTRILTISFFHIRVICVVPFMACFSFPFLYSRLFFILVIIISIILIVMTALYVTFFSFPSEFSWLTYFSCDSIFISVIWIFLKKISLDIFILHLSL